MPYYQFSIADNSTNISKVKNYISSYKGVIDFNSDITKDAVEFAVEFKEQYEINKFDQDIKVMFPYLFVE